MRSLTSGTRDTLADLRGWSTRRWLIVAVVASALSGVMAVASGMWAAAPVGNLSTAPSWWTYAIAGAGVVLSALTVATYIGAPLGAEATFCDLRWPILGLVGIALAIDAPGQMSPLTELFDSSTVMAISARPILGVLALALLAWALMQRLILERSVTAAAVSSNTHDGNAGETCTTCRPLFPSHSLPPQGWRPGEEPSR